MSAVDVFLAIVGAGITGLVIAGMVLPQGAPPRVPRSPDRATRRQTPRSPGSERRDHPGVRSSRGAARDSLTTAAVRVVDRATHPPTPGMVSAGGSPDTFN